MKTNWMRSFWLMLQWELQSLRLVLPLAISAQILFGAGLAIGFGFLLGDIGTDQALYLATGVTVTSMLTIGLALVPQLVAQHKHAGTYDFIWSLPVPRTCSIAASLAVNSLIAFPGMILALLIASWRWELALHVSPLIVPAALLTLVTGASIGFAMAHSIPNPFVTTLVANVLVFVILLYSPINYPPERLPDWLASIHLLLPFQHAANVMQTGLTENLATNVGLSFSVLGAWALSSWLVRAAADPEQGLPRLPSEDSGIRCRDVV